MNYYSVTIEIIKNGQHESLETHYAIGDNGNSQLAINSVKDTVRKLFAEKYPDDRFEFVAAPGGVFEISKEMYESKK